MSKQILLLKCRCRSYLLCERIMHITHMRGTGRVKKNAQTVRVNQRSSINKKYITVTTSNTLPPPTHQFPQRAACAIVAPRRRDPRLPAEIRSPVAIVLQLAHPGPDHRALRPPLFASLPTSPASAAVAVCSPRQVHQTVPIVSSFVSTQRTSHKQYPLII